jgi:glycogen debranching enzyme
MITAIVRVEGEAGKRRAKQLLENIKPHLSDAGIGTISEIFDAEPPHTPRGCMAQAWGVAEVLRAYIEEVMAEVPKAAKMRSAQTSSKPQSLAMELAQP